MSSSLRGRDADDADAEALQALGDAGRRAGLPDDGDGRRERDDALVVEAEGVADLRQRASRPPGSRCNALTATTWSAAPAANSISVRFGATLTMRSRAGGACGCAAGGERAARPSSAEPLQASTSRRNAAPRARTARSSRRQSKAGPGSVLRPGAMSLWPAIHPSASDG